jgi:dihydropteroate synthase
MIMVSENNELGVIIITDEEKQVHDRIKLTEEVSVIRYLGSKSIERMMENEQFIDAFVHAQLDIEKILWDKVVGIFKNEPVKAMEVRRRIDNFEGKKPTTRQLIDWSYFLGAITREEFDALTEFNKARNRIIHGHGEWWVLDENKKQYYKDKLKLAIQFLESNEFY